MQSPILGPVVALAAWTLVMMGWLYATRLPAMARAGIELRTRVGSRPGGLDGVLPDHVQWKAHNYNHLLEQPTIFYAVALVLAIAGAGHGVALYLAWAYVAIRVCHSLVQATTNRIMLRFPLFALASLVLIALTLRATIAVF